MTLVKKYPSVIKIDRHHLVQPAMPAMSKACITVGVNEKKNSPQTAALPRPALQALEMSDGYPDELEGMKLIKSDTAEAGYKVFMHVFAVWTELWGHSEQSFPFSK